EVQPHTNQIKPYEGMPPNTMRFGVLDTRVRDKGKPRLTYDEFGRTNNLCLKVGTTEALVGDEENAKKSPEIEQQWQGGGGDQNGTRKGQRRWWLHVPTSVRVTQTTEIVPGQVFRDSRNNGRLTRQLDTCLIRYQLSNESGKPQEVGLRFLLDTFIGDNDG